jgi:hypothetical protein
MKECGFPYPTFVNLEKTKTYIFTLDSTLRKKTPAFGSAPERSVFSPECRNYIHQKNTILQHRIQSRFRPILRQKHCIQIIEIIYAYFNE